MATRSSVPAWRIPRTEGPAGYSPRGHKERDTTEQVTLHFKSISALCNNSRFLTKQSFRNPRVLLSFSPLLSVTDEETGPGGGTCPQLRRGGRFRPCGGEWGRCWGLQGPTVSGQPGVPTHSHVHPSSFSLADKLSP